MNVIHNLLCTAKLARVTQNMLINFQSVPGRKLRKREWKKVDEVYQISMATFVVISNNSWDDIVLLHTFFTHCSCGVLAVLAT